MHMPIEPEAMNGLKLNLSLSKNPMASEIVWWVKLRPITPLIGDRIVGLADARHQQELNVEDGEGGEDDEVSRLLPLLAAGIDEGDAGRSLAGAVDD